MGEEREERVEMDNGMWKTGGERGMRKKGR